MFDFFKKKENKECKIESTQKKDFKEIKIEIEKIEKVKEKDFDVLVQLGLLYAKIEEDDKAIEYLEKSLEINKNIGDGYKQLMSLYNKKRRKYSKDYDDKKLQYYLNKIDYMLQISKDYVRGK
ncbi:tetratricopeptide repeat protein [uncultured Sneathia sp.]|uniref:tetratricopeptide repeat protein n=1 Tax=uncultured Sneathia sp. TaxID=278067 RepID=UPI00259A85CC|nr:tetratricopeptide repeat protein [uncultured Sneathia sp.]